MNAVRRLRALAQVTQSRLARLGGTSQPTIAAYESGRKSPTIRTLRRLAVGVRMQVTIDFVPPLTREDRRSLALHEAVIQHLEADPEGVIGRAQRTLSLMRRRHPGAERLLREWSVLLDRPLPHLVEAVRDPRPSARALRQVSPFAGVLSAPERAAVYRRFREVEAMRE